MSPELGSDLQLLRDVAQDVSALHDPDLILTGLVRRVRSAVGCDLAYLSLNDTQTRYTEIRFSDGIRTPEYAAIRMPIGTGVLGMAAAGVTTESPDYLRDVAKLHVETVDAAVNAEGVRAILSTPLRAGGEVVGALTVANRSAGVFSSVQKAVLDEAALIGSIAADVHNLRRRLERQEAEFRDETERLASTAAVEASQLRLSDELATALAAGQGTSELLTIASRAIEGTVRLADARSSESSESSHTVVAELDAGGVLEMEGNPEPITRLTPVIATFLSIALLYERAIEDARHLRESELVQRLVDPPSDASGGEIRTGLAGAGTLDVVVVEIQDPNLRRSALSKVRFEFGRAAIAAERRGSLVVIARSSAAGLDMLTKLLGPFVFFGGVETAQHDAAIPEAFGQASLMVRSMRALRRPNEIAGTADLGVVAFAIGHANGPAERYVQAQLGPVVGPSARDARLLETALHYLDAQGAVGRVATELAVHENTVRQRLEKLDERLPGWRTSPKVLDVHVALRTHALLSAKASIEHR